MIWRPHFSSRVFLANQNAALSKASLAFSRTRARFRRLTAFCASVLLILLSFLSSWTPRALILQSPSSHRDMTTMVVPSRQLFIGGKWVSPTLGERIPVINPATEQTIGTIPAATADDVNAAVNSARDAYYRNNGRDWPRTTGTYRAKFLKAIASKITEKKDRLGQLESMDMGKPLDEALWDMDDVAGCFDYYADLAEKLDAEQGSSVEVPMEQFKVHIRKEPLGVVGLITPWNYPLLMAAWKVAPALAAGCTCVLKPSEIASVTCLELAAVAEEVGLPPGVLNVITGYGAAAGAPLSSHPGIDKVAFTGSSATGKAVLKAAADNLKPATMELGGKSAIVVFDDVDVDKGTLPVSKEATTRSIAPAFKARLQEWASAIKTSDPLEKGCRLGPVVSEGQHKKVLGFIEQAKSEGAVVLAGGKRPVSLSRGYFVEPTVLEVEPHMTIWREEVFGPVLSVVTFDTEEDAIAMANDSSYGLAAAVISQDADRCRRLSEAFECGIVWVNCSQPCFVQGPWGGKKRSGFGRELGKWGLDNYLSVKQVVSYVSQDAWAWYPPPAKL